MVVPEEKNVAATRGGQGKTSTGEQRHLERAENAADGVTGQDERWREIGTAWKGPGSPGGGAGGGTREARTGQTAPCGLPTVPRGHPRPAKLVYLKVTTASYLRYAPPRPPSS